MKTPSRRFTSLAGKLAMFAMALAVPLSSFAQSPTTAKPTVVLVHGAFADASSWNAVIARLHAKGYPVIAAPNELRSVKTDAAEISSLVKSIPGPVVLVGHSYGGSVISQAADGLSNVKALVYVAAFAPEVGESAAQLAGQFPGSTLGPALAPPVALADGGKDLYIQQDKFRAQFAADVPADQARLMAAGQRPITDAALHEASTTAAWKRIPGWFVYGSADLNIPPAAQAFMAKRAHAKKVEEIKGASHVVMVSHPDAVAAMIVEAASATATKAGARAR